MDETNNKMKTFEAFMSVKTCLAQFFDIYQGIILAILSFNIHIKSLSVSIILFEQVYIYSNLE